MKEFMDYERPSVTSDVVLLRTINSYVGERNEPNKELQVRLYKRKEEPFNNKWSIPGGFVSIDETIESVAKNKTLEKANYSNFYIEQLYTFDKIDRDARWRVISTAFIGIVKNEQQADSLSNLYESMWFTIKGNKLISEVGNTEISFSDLAFDHGDIIQKALDRIRGKIFYSEIVFEFLNELFTISELRKTFEVILNRRLDNFQRTIGDRVIKTDYVYKGKACRPANYFKKNTEWRC